MRLIQELYHKSRRINMNETIIHIMADGTIRDSIEGVTVPVTNTVYDVLGGCYEDDASFTEQRLYRG